ncbi:MAG: hypothetical protein SGARI_003089 [Bacillariaceae sp.]
MTEEQWRKIKHLMGRNPGGNPLDVKELSEFGPLKQNDGSEIYRLLYGYLARLELAVYFGNMEFAEKMAIECRKNDKDNSFTTNSLRLRHYRRKARRCYKELKSLCDIKGLNSWHRCLVMEAQLKTMATKEVSRVEATFDRALQCCLSSGHIQDAGLACQLAAEFLSSLPNQDQQHQHSAEFGQSNTSLLQKYLDQARSLYYQWGAYRLVQHLEKKYQLEPLSVSMCDATSVATQSLLSSYQHRVSSITGLSSSAGAAAGAAGGGSVSLQHSYLSIGRDSSISAAGGVGGVPGNPYHHHQQLSSAASSGLPVLLSSSENSGSSKSNNNRLSSSHSPQQINSSGRTPPLLEEQDEISVMTDQWKDSGGRETHSSNG